MTREPREPAQAHRNGRGQGWPSASGVTWFSSEKPSTYRSLFPLNVPT